MQDADITRVLIIDDESQIARSMKRVLRGCDVTLVNNGEEGVAEACNQEFDVIFCDLMMPGMNGIDVHKAIAAQKPGLEDKIVFMSGGAYTERGQIFLSGVSNRCLSKPFDIDEIREVVAEYDGSADKAQ